MSRANANSQVLSFLWNILTFTVESKCVHQNYWTFQSPSTITITSASCVYMYKQPSPRDEAFVLQDLTPCVVLHHCYQSQDHVGNYWKPESWVVTVSLHAELVGFGLRTWSSGATSPVTSCHAHSRSNFQSRQVVHWLNVSEVPPVYAGKTNKESTSHCPVQCKLRSIQPSGNGRTTRGVSVWYILEHCAITFPWELSHSHGRFDWLSD